MKRLKANHVSSFINKEIQKDILDNDRVKKIMSDKNYLIAKELIECLPVVETNDLLFRTFNMIKGGLFSDLGTLEDNKEQWIERYNKELYKQNIRIAELNEMSMHEIVNKIFNDIPMVPVGDLVQDLYQDIQNGLFNDCGNPKTNWECWLEKAKSILKSRGIIGKKNCKEMVILENRIKNRMQKMAYKFSTEELADLMKLNPQLSIGQNEVDLDEDNLVKQLLNYNIEVQKNGLNFYLKRLGSKKMSVKLALRKLATKKMDISTIVKLVKDNSQIYLTKDQLPCSLGELQLALEKEGMFADTMDGQKFCAYIGTSKIYDK